MFRCSTAFVGRMARLGAFILLVGFGVFSWDEMNALAECSQVSASIFLTIAFVGFVTGLSIGMKLTGDGHI